MPRKIEKLNLNHCFHFHGLINNKDALDIVSQNDFGLCFLHPIENNKNSIVTKFFEYMSKSLPIIATDIENWKDFFEFNKCGINIDIFDIENESKRIIDFIQNVDFIIKIKNNIISNVKKYTWENEFKKIMTEYNKFDSNFE